MYLTSLICKKKNMKSITISVGIVMLLLFYSCGGGKTPIADAIIERDSLAVMETLGMTTLVSDSGVIRYKIDADEWLIFDKKEPSYWSFEKGVYVEQFDSVFQVQASIKADTAYYYDKDKLWKLVSNVSIQNLKGEIFETDLMYWDQKTEKVYSDAFVKIIMPDKTITGYGFDSNQQMTQSEIRNIQGIFYVDEEEVSVENTIQEDNEEANVDDL